MGLNCNGKYPNDWRDINLGKSSVLKARIGWQGLTVNEYLKTGNYYLVTGTDFKNGRIDWDNCVHVEKERFDQDKYIQLRVSDILVTKDGTIGKVAFINKVFKPTTLNSGVFVIRPNNQEYEPAYLYHILMSNHFETFLKKLTAGSTISHLYQKDFIRYNFPIPPTLTEQQAIATALSDVDELIANLEKLIEKKKAFKQGAMQQLLTPKENWVKRQISDIAEVGRGRVISHKEIDSSIDNSYPVYSSQTSNNGIMGYIGTYDFEGEYVTWTTDGVNAGTVFFRNGKFNCTNVCGTLKFKNDNPRFIAICLNNVTSKYVSRNLANPKLMNDVMKKIELIIPLDIAEQNLIADRMDFLESNIILLERKLTKLLLVKQGMMQELLTGRTRLI